MKNKTQMSKLGEPEFEFGKDNEDTGIEILDMHSKIVNDVSKIKFDEKGKYKTINLDVINVTTSGEQSEPNKGGTIYRVFLYKEKMYMFRKQAIDIAQVFNIENIEKFNPLVQSIPAEEVIFKLTDQL